MNQTYHFLLEFPNICCRDRSGRILFGMRSRIAYNRATRRLLRKDAEAAKANYLTQSKKRSIRRLDRAALSSYVTCK